MGSNEGTAIPPPKVRSVMRALYPGIRFGDEKLGSMSWRRLREHTVSVVTRGLHFGKMQKKLLRAVASHDLLTSFEVVKITRSKAPKTLVLEVNNKLKRDRTYGQLIRVKFSRKRAMHGYYLKILTKES